MYVQMIRLRNFRCYTDFSMHFGARLTVIVAENGKGKTAILDGLAIALSPYLKAFPGSGARNFQQNDVRMVLETPRAGASLTIPRMKYLLPVSVELRTADEPGTEDGFTWKRELRTVKGRTTSAEARQVTAYGKQLYDALNREKDTRVTLPVLGYYGTGRMWNDSSLLKEKKIDLSRSSGYTECLEPSGSYNTFGWWFRYAEESARNLRSQQEC